MSRYSLEDLEDDSAFFKSTAVRQTGEVQVTGTSGSLRPEGPALNLTTLSVSEIMQGAALYRPQVSTYNKFRVSIEDDLTGLIKSQGTAESVLGGRAQLLPLDIMSRTAWSQSYYASLGSASQASIEGSGSNSGGISVPSTGDVAVMIVKAADEIGYTENPPGSNRNKFAAEASHANGQYWCATFVVAMARRAGITLPSESAYTPTMAQAFRDAGSWHTSNPQAGDIIFFNFPNDSKNRIQHVGIVEQVTANAIITIEGNTSSTIQGSQDNGGGVYRKTWQPNSSSIVGYGRITSPSTTTTTTTTVSSEM
jgi:cell wall-associated NlpC family hydrolase